MAEFQIDRASGALLVTTSYNTSPSFGDGGDGNAFVTYNSYWYLSLNALDGSVSRSISGYSDQPFTIVGPYNLLLDPTPSVRSFDLSFESYADALDASTDGYEWYNVQSGAYLTTQAEMSGRETGEGPYFSNADLLIGGSADDRLHGLEGNDWLDGGDGADLIDGGDGNDVVIAGASNDTVDGGAGNDRLDGGAGADTLRGGSGDDSYTIDRYDTVLELAGGGIDTLLVSTNAFTLADPNVENLIRLGNASFRGTGNAGANAITGGGSTDILDGSAGDDVLNGGDGNDTLIGGAGADALNGGAGIDTASYETATRSASVNLLTGAVAGAAAGDNFSSVEIVKGTAFKDLLRGDAAANTLYGYDDADDLRGGDGNDILHGGAGNDRLIGEAGHDRLTGGAGDDVFFFSGGGGRDTVTDFIAGAGSGDVLRIGSGLAFDSFADILAVSLQSGANTIIRFDAGNSVTLLNVTLASLNSGDFLFA